MVERVARMLLIVLAIASCAWFAYGKDALQVDRRGDAALFEQITANIGAGRGPVSNVFAATQNFIDRGYVYRPPEQLLHDHLLPAAHDERNMLGFHAYWILYLLAPLTRWIPVSLLLSLAQAASYLGLLVAAMLLTLRHTRSAVATAAAGAVVATNPAWLGALYGQFYPDRLFVGLGFLLLMQLQQGVRLRWILPTLLLLGMVNERAALIAGIVCTAWPMVEPGVSAPIPRSLRTRLVIAGLGIIMLAYSAYEKDYVLVNSYYGGFLPHSLHEAVARFAIPGFVQNTIVLLAVQGTLLLLAFVHPRLGVLSLLCMAPNILGNVGGAEKIGWMTHYQSYYLPVLDFGAVTGLCTLWSRGRRWARLGLLPLLALQWFMLHHEMASGRLPDAAGLRSAWSAAQARWRGQPTGIDLRRDIVKALPQHSLVVTNELGIAMVFQAARVDVFPVDADRANALLIPCDWGAQSSTPLVTSAWLRTRGFPTAPTRHFDSIGLCLWLAERGPLDRPAGQVAAPARMPASLPG